MGDTQSSIGCVSGLIGIGLMAINVGNKYLKWELPEWAGKGIGYGGIGFIALACLLLFRMFLDAIGVASNSPWPSTFVYAIICASLIFIAGYWPVRMASEQSGDRQCNWQPALAESFLLSLDSFETGPRPDRVKIIATKEGMPIARLIAQALKHYKWQIEVDTVNGSHVFLSNNAFRGTRIRYRESRQGECVSVFGVVSALAEIPTTVFFPEDDQFNFSQIEIGDVPENYSGPQRFMNDSFK